MTHLELGAWQPLTGGTGGMLALPPHHLLTHGIVVGMTGSGKTGLLFVLVEEAVRAGVPVLMVDLKGDLPNLALCFDDLGCEPFLPWASSLMGPSEQRSAREVAEELAAQRRKGLEAWGVTSERLRLYRQALGLRVLTPGSNAGERVHLLSSLERPSERWRVDRESASLALSAAVSLVLRLLGRDSDPARSREHVLLSVLSERRLSAGQPADLGSLIKDLLEPPIEAVGALPIDGFVSAAQRATLAAALNALLVAPTFASWREGADLDVGAWLTSNGPRTPAVVFSVAHLEDEERALVLGLLLDEVLGWVRSLPGTQRLRALVVIDETFGLLPPHPNNPPTKGPIVSLMKQARAYGVGVVLATQNPMDLDYRALSNAGLWCIGRLQTDADRARVIEGLSVAGAGASSPKELNGVIKKLSKRWFVLRDAHDEHGLRLLQPRWAYSFMRGPMTRAEIRMALAGSGSRAAGSLAAAAGPTPSPEPRGDTRG